VTIEQDLQALLKRTLQERKLLEATDIAALEDLPYRVQTYEPAKYLVREGAPSDVCPLLISGFAFRQKLTNAGARQIVAIQIPGEFLDLDNLFLSESDHNVQTLTRCTVASFPLAGVRKLVQEYPAISTALWTQALVRASVYREWIVNVGRRDARTRIAHLLCEFAFRLKNAGISDGFSYELPVTQEQMADAVGLTPVHVNRVLRALESDGLIARNKRHVSIADWNQLTEEADFTIRYLHLPDSPAA